MTSEAPGASCYLTKGKIGSKYIYKVKFMKIDNDILFYFNIDLNDATIKWIYNPKQAKIRYTDVASQWGKTFTKDP